MAKNTSTVSKPARKPTARRAAPRASTKLDEEIRARAFSYYRRRIDERQPGDDLTDWLRAESDVKREHGLA